MRLRKRRHGARETQRDHTEPILCTLTPLTAQRFLRSVASARDVLLRAIGALFWCAATPNNFFAA